MWAERPANHMGYDYNDLKEDADALSKQHKCVELFSMGESVTEKKLFCIKIGDGQRKLFINGAHHGLEYLTSAFIMKFLKDYAYSAENETDFFACDVQSLIRKTSLYAVPMVNPDGVDIAVHGIDVSNPYHRKLIAQVGIHNFRKVWQANANGVDINHNYNADWQAIKACPSPTLYSGPYPESEPETKAVVDFVRNINFDMLIAFHSQGGEIYYDFNGKTAENSLKLASEFAKVSGYAVAAPEGTASFGGCKDWFINEFGKAGFTIEIGRGENPLPLDMLDCVYKENAPLLISALRQV